MSSDPSLSSYPGAEHFQQLLLQMMTPNTEVVMAASTELNRLLKVSACVEVLFHLTQAAPDNDVRIMAAVLLRKRIAGHWARVADHQTAITSTLLQMLQHDASVLSRGHRRALANLAAIVARVTLPVGQWPELLEFLVACTKAQSPEHRELMDSVDEQLAPHFTTLHTIILAAMQDPVAEVRTVAMASVRCFLDWMETPEQHAMVKQFLEPLLCNIRNCIDSGNEEQTHEAFEAFQMLAEEHFELIADCVDVIVAYFLTVGANSTLELSTRMDALHFIEVLIRLKPKTFLSRGYFDATLTVLTNMCVEEAGDGEEEKPEPDEEDEDEEETAYSFGISMIDVMALFLPTKLCYSPLMNHVVQLIADGSSPLKRRTGMAILGTISEGFGDGHCAQLEQLLQIVFQGLEDPSHVVRSAALFALSEFSRQLQPEICDYANQIIPRIFQLVNSDASAHVRYRCLYAYQSFAESLSPEDIAPHIDSVANLCMSALSSTDDTIKELVFPVLSATVLSAKDHFLPYVPGVMTMIGHVFQDTNPEHVLVRARALEFVGVVAVSIKEAFMPYLDGAMATAMELVKDELPEVREYTYGYFNHVAQILEQDFNPYLPAIFPYLLASTQSDDGLVATDEDDDSATTGGIEQDELGEVSIQLVQSYIDEKTAAIRTLGSISRFCRALLPEIPAVIAVFKELIEHPVYVVEPDIRCSVIRAMADMVDGVYAVQPVPWEHGKLNPLPADLVAVVNEIMNHIVVAVREDEEYEMVLACFEALSQMLVTVGPSLLANHGQVMIDNFVLILERKVACLQVRERFDDDDGDLEFNIFNAATVALVEIAQALGELIAPHFPAIYTAAKDYLRPRLASDYQLVAIGLIAELVVEVKAAAAPFVPEIMAYALQGLQSPDEPTFRRNSAYCIRALVLQCPKEVSEIDGGSALNNLMQLLALLLADTEKVEVRENALSCLAAVTLAYSSVVPLDQVWPVFVKNLPLENDHECGGVIYELFRALVTANIPGFESNYPAIVSIVLREVANGKLHESHHVHEKIVAVLQHLLQHSNYAQHIRDIAGSLTLNEEQHARVAGLLLQLGMA